MINSPIDANGLTGSIPTQLGALLNLEQCYMRKLKRDYQKCVKEKQYCLHLFSAVMLNSL